MRHSFLLALLFALAIPCLAATPARPYHLRFEASPAAPFPFLSKFGTVTLDVYGGGVRAETPWLNAFSRNATPSITIMNPFGRMYTEVPIANVGSIVGTLSAGELKNMSAMLATPVNGRVGELPATRYRLIFGPAAYIDVWSTHAIPENARFRAIVTQFVTGIAPQIGALTKTIPGTPVYVELNFRRYKKLALLKLTSIKYDNEGEQDALTVGSLYFHASVLDAIWK
jgi:hypothetical protein